MFYDFRTPADCLFQTLLSRFLLLSVCASFLCYKSLLLMHTCDQKISPQQSTLPMFFSLNFCSCLPLASILVLSCRASEDSQVILLCLFCNGVMPLQWNELWLARGVTVDGQSKATGMRRTEVEGKKLRDHVSFRSIPLLWHIPLALTHLL